MVREEKERRERQREEWRTQSELMQAKSDTCHVVVLCYGFAMFIVRPKEPRTGSARSEIEGRKRAADNQRCQSTKIATSCIVVM